MNRIRTLDLDDLNERLKELIDARDDFSISADRPESESADEAAQAWAQENPDDAAELGRLEALRDEIGSKGDLICGDAGPFVAEESFEEYAEQVAEEIGAIERGGGWPLSYIDWSRAADALKMDYRSIEWDGTTYWYRG